MNALEIRNLTKSYPGFTLDNINLTLPSGCIMGLIGENGAGKSTTIKLILDMIHKDSGSITILGKDNQDNIELTKEDIGVVLDEVGLPECLTAQQVGNVMKHTFRNWDDAEYAQLLKKLALPEQKRTTVGMNCRARTTSQISQRRLQAAKPAYAIKNIV